MLSSDAIERDDRICRKIQKLWGGRFEGTVEDWVEQFGASISFDHQPAKFDLIIPSSCSNARHTGILSSGRGRTDPRWSERCCEI